ncbi:MAG TPA: DnaJ domain-containing protein [Candidatus Angelobacter sp.]|nr:DnaJ domain-containing protein [Candidatus Angelobacter sp.]
MSPQPTFDPYVVLQVVPSCEQEVVHAAYRALARKYHPDHDATRRAADKMAELNRAYALLREADARAAFDRSRRRTIAGVSVAAGPGAPAARAPSSATRSATGSVIGFGRYAGWALRDIARHDPEYLLWLSRHSSGIRYRTEIYSILGATGRPAA